MERGTTESLLLSKHFRTEVLAEQSFLDVKLGPMSGCPFARLTETALPVGTHKSVTNRKRQYLALHDRNTAPATAESYLKYSSMFVRRGDWPIVHTVIGMPGGPFLFRKRVRKLECAVVC